MIRLVKIYALATLGLMFWIAASSSALANNTDDGGGGDNGGGNAGNGSTPAGVEIDALGTLRIMRPDPRVTMARMQAARQTLPPQLARPSKMRKISLNRLEEAVAELVAKGEQPSPAMVAMAGLTRLEYVMFYPESGDIVFAGPAEGFTMDSVGRIVGIETGRPCILLDDVIVALRAFAPGSKPTQSISVSIDPTQDGLARMQKTLQQIGGAIQSTSQIPTVVNALRQSLGLNEVTIEGIPGGTHFAHVLTEADYRMKLIGIGLEQPPVPLITYVSRLTASMTSSNALVRWYFVPDYEAIAVSEDGLAMRMVGQGVKLIGEGELVTRDGERKRNAGREANPASRAFTTDFTKKFEAIANTVPVYSQLRNMIDLSIAAAFVQEQGYYDQSGWDLGVFASEDELPVEVFPAPQNVETAINAIIAGNRLITPIGGGVSIQARKALNSENVKPDADKSIERFRSEVELKGLEDGQWWWD